MSRPLLVPISVAAHVTKQAQPVPKLGGAPFQQESALEPGVHLHWALPDALTRARLPDKSAPAIALFPAVPDRWLVVRLDPGGEPNATNRRRAWHAWVVDSRTQTAEPLETWIAPAPAADNLVHTVAGMLPSAADLGFRGWGMLPKGSAGFDPVLAAYYPEARRRFGFHDQVGTLAGVVGYTVIGWYADPDDDPLFRATDRAALLERLKLAYTPSPLYKRFSPAVSATSPLASTWQVASIKIAQRANLSAAQQRDVQRRARVIGTPAIHEAQQRSNAARFAAAHAGAAQPAPNLSLAQLQLQRQQPNEIVCHGSVFEVQLDGAGALAPLSDQQVRLYPSITRALAEIASLKHDPQRPGQPGERATALQVDFTEILLQELDQQKGTVGGLLDMPGAAHARSFQGVPGKSSFYAQIDICPPAPQQARPAIFALSQAPERPNRTGHWPERPGRAAATRLPPACTNIPPALRRNPGPLPSAPPNSDAYALALEALLGPWRKDVRDKLGQARAAAKKPLHPQLVYVHDYRKNAQSPSQGPTVGGGGSDESGWWLDVNDDDALGQLYVLAVGASVHLPDPDNIYEQPGPRWYRPWSPQVALLDAGRSYRFGADGNFDEHGFLRCRDAGQTLSAFTIGDRSVAARPLADVSPLGAAPGVPRIAQALVEESILIDTETSPVMAGVTTPAAATPGSFLANRDRMRTAVQGLWLRSVALPDDPNARAALAHTGTLPSPVAITIWSKNQFDPIFLDADYSHPHTSVAEDWKLDEHHVECRPTSDPPPPARGVLRFAERSYVTATLANVLDSALVSKRTTGPTGRPVRGVVSDALDKDTFKKMAIVSAPLTRFDDTLIASHRRGERTGALRLNRIDLVDVFGVRRSWSSPIAPESSAGGPDLPFWTQLAPRLPGWSRLQLRLQAAGDTSQEASALAPAICGFLLPDFLEHALEVYDGAGKALGQLVSTPPSSGTPAALDIRFQVHPWVAKGLAPGAETSVIENPTLLAFVEGVLAQSAAVPVGNSFENGLTAMLRVIDTIRGTIDPDAKSADRRVRLLGEPIVVLAAQLSLESTSASRPAGLLADPAPLSGVTQPRVPVRIGDATRPDDGVLGCFMAGATPAASRFAAVSAVAVEGAIRSGPTGDGFKLPATHPFVKERANLFTLAPGEWLSLVILADPRGAIYATCGVLPRKTIGIPREFLDAALHRLRPTFRAGPLLALPQGASLKPALPPPQIPGMHATFVRSDDMEQEAPFARSVPIAELPLGRALLTEGWIRLFYDEDKKS